MICLAALGGLANTALMLLILVRFESPQNLPIFIVCDYLIPLSYPKETIGNNLVSTGTQDEESALPDGKGCRKKANILRSGWQ